MSEGYTLGAQRLNFNAFLVLLISEGCSITILNFPRWLNFDQFAFWDWGGHLVTDYLLRQHYRVLDDFAYQYGLLPLLIQESWFQLSGSSPVNLLVLSVPFGLIAALTLGMFAVRENESAARTLVLLSLPFTICLAGDLPHILEPALLCAGLISQARGNRPTALAFATAACFTKASMGYLYGLVLLSFIAADLGRQHQLHTSRLARALAPALCTGVVLLVILASRFGLCTVFRSLLPSAGYRGYGELGFGVKSLFGLFYFRGVKPGYYVGTPVLFWALATIYLFASAALASMRCLRIRNAEIVISCAVMHFGFITFFFGAPSSWTYYAYIPIISAVETANWGSKARKMLWTLCIFAALANISGVKAAIQAWHSTRDADTAWLFATPTERAEWNQITLMAQHTYADVFTWDGGAEMLFPWLCKPVGAFIVPGVVTKSELSRKLRRLQSVQLVIVPTFNGDQFEKWPDKEFATALNDMSIAFAGTYFKVYRRESFPPGTTGSCGE